MSKNVSIKKRDGFRDGSLALVWLTVSYLLLLFFFFFFEFDPVNPKIQKC